jgi:hypothetical protein
MTKKIDLDVNADRPDRNGGDRTHEAALGRTIAAYGVLRKSGVLT